MRVDEKANLVVYRDKLRKEEGPFFMGTTRKSGSGNYFVMNY